MNLMVLHNLCDKSYNDCLESFKHSIDNLPFEITPQESIDNLIEFEIEQKFGGKVLKRMINNYNLSKIQLKFTTNTIYNYKTTLLDDAYSYYEKNHLN